MIFNFQIIPSEFSFIHFSIFSFYLDVYSIFDFHFVSEIQRKHEQKRKPHFIAMKINSNQKLRAHTERTNERTNEKKNTHSKRNETKAKPSERKTAEASAKNSSYILK